MFFINNEYSLLFLLSTAMHWQALDNTKLSTANNDFGLRLLKQLNVNDDNIFFSPFSIASAFAMLYEGATGNTKMQMRQTLGFNFANINDDQMRESMEDLLVLAQNTRNVELAIGNRILQSKGISVLPEYSSRLQRSYQASILNVDFANDGEQVLRSANKWVNATTRGKIPKLFDQPFDQSTMMVLMNAIYFKGAWLKPFDSEFTTEDDFHSPGGITRTQFMIQTDKRFRTSSISELNARLLEMPYQGEEMSMFILLPNEIDGLAQVKQKLSTTTLSGVGRRGFSGSIDVIIPKFKFEKKLQLDEILPLMGIVDAFNGDADFSGITGAPNMRVSKAIHKAVIEVNEEGAEAAAATGIEMIPMAAFVPEPVFKADHPFIFWIQDKRNQLILFLGQVVKF